MAIAGALIGKALGAFGKKPEIPKLEAINPSAIQMETIGGNMDALPNLEQLGAAINAFNSEQQIANISRALEFALPGGLGKAQKIVSSQLAGEIPADVQQQIFAGTAGRALAGGFGGSGLGRNLTARDLGTTSMGIQQQGLANFGALGAMVPNAPLFDVTSMFFSPQQRLGFAVQQQQATFQRDLMANQVAAMPDPATAALAKEIDRFFNTAASVGMMAAGNAFGGGGGGEGEKLFQQGMSGVGNSAGGVQGGWSNSYINPSAGGGTVGFGQSGLFS